jgi:hypothetical protein
MYLKKESKNKQIRNMKIALLIKIEAKLIKPKSKIYQINEKTKDYFYLQ